MGLWNRWKATAIEWLAVIIACAASTLAIICMFISAICIGIIWSQENRIDALEDDIDVYRIRAAKLNAWMAANGVPTEVIYDDDDKP